MDTRGVEVLAVASLVLLGGLSVVGYQTTQRLQGQNEAMALEVARLEANLTQLSAVLAETQAAQASLAQEATQFQMSIAQQGSQQAATAQQVAAAQAGLRDAAQELSDLSARLAGVQAGNITALKEASAELQNVSSRVAALESTLSLVMPEVFLRTQGTALASYVDGPGGMTYLRLTESGPDSLVESAMGNRYFNASVPGATVQWYAMGNGAATDYNHWFWPLVLENSPGGTEAIEFEQVNGVQEAAVVSGGTRVVAGVEWDPAVPHLFKVVVVEPGRQVDFYIDGELVAAIYQQVPVAGFLILGAEIKASATAPNSVAMVDVYGGLLGSS